MFPVIFDFGIINIFGFQFRLAIYSFGLMLVIAFYTCYFLLNYDLKKLGYDEKLASDIIFWSAVGGIVGAKIYYILENIEDLIASQNPIGMVFSGAGLVFLGGLIGAVIAVTIILKKNKLSWLFFADLLAPLIILGYAIGRLGCFLVGDDYGIPSKLPWAISFPEGLPPTTSQVFEFRYPWIDLSKFETGLLTVHPTQIYEFLICSLLFYFLWNQRKNISVKGSLFFTYLICSGIERFLIEFLRTNHKYFLNTFSGAQVLSFFMICIGFYFLLNPLPQEISDKV
ncbi:prolipoprotein diacylglyceryl transferase [Candidatus Marinimicrobia bacterium]|nr:prolipoprotein diacylglyceryl transferase [Candidatus Neomarinimicrobiota bacterium]